MPRIINILILLILFILQIYEKKIAANRFESAISV